jgi:hypothetical protein
MSTKNYTQEEQIQNINIAIVKASTNINYSGTERAQICYKLKQEKLKIMQSPIEVKPQNEVRFYEGSYQFKVNKTDLNITEDFITMILAKQYEYRPTQDILWAVVLEENKEVARYSFDYTLGLAKQY